MKIREKGYAASYTFPMLRNRSLIGFIFFNSSQTNSFFARLLDQLDLFAQLITQLVINELLEANSLVAALKSANDMVHYRDPETGNHLERMSRYSRLIAQTLTKKGIKSPIPKNFRVLTNSS